MAGTNEEKKNTYVESDAVKAARESLDTQAAAKPGAYQSQWQTQLNDTIGKIMNREKFSYDLNGDALYQQYKDQYVNQGKMAMMDTMGQAAALTGGYGNSYAQMAGQQAYQGQLQGLNDKIPELYQLALDKYTQEGQDLYSQYSLLSAQDQTDYGRHRDSVSDWYTDRDYQYGQYRDVVSDDQWQAEFNEALRQFDFANKLGEFAPTKSSGGDDGSASGGGSGNKDDTGIDVEGEYIAIKQAGAKGTELDRYLTEMVNEGNISKNAATDLRDKRW